MKHPECVRKYGEKICKSGIPKLKMTKEYTNGKRQIIKFYYCPMCKKTFQNPNAKFKG